jgi:hypothetical protein
MTADEFVSLVGLTVAHATYAENISSIRAGGLQPPVALVAAAGLDPAVLTLRRSPVRMQIGAHKLRLNDQRQLWKGRHQRFLEGHSLDSWSAQLDERIFFLPHGDRALKTPFVASLGPGAMVMQLDARRFFHAFAPHIWLSPINSGNADRRAVYRGDWIYVPVSAALTDFRLNRQRRGLRKGPDDVMEISIKRGIAADELAKLTGGAGP